jgi:predicted nucleotidyltransferase
MLNHDPNVSAVELVAHALGPLRDELVLVGGCAVGLLITDAGRPPVRQTADVDLIAQVASVGDFYRLHPRLRECGFVESADAENICRWRKGSLIVDVMPTTDVIGHSVNGWYADAVKAPVRMTLPSGVPILVISAPLFVATKVESFHGRGNGDYLHHDMEDILNVVDGREELLREVQASSSEVREFLQTEFEDLLSDPTFVDQLSWQVTPEARVEVVVKRLRSLAGL